MQRSADRCERAFDWRSGLLTGVDELLTSVDDVLTGVDQLLTDVDEPLTDVDEPLTDVDGRLGPGAARELARREPPGGPGLAGGGGRRARAWGKFLALSVAVRGGLAR